MGNTMTCSYCGAEYITDGGSEQRDYNHIINKGKCYTNCRNKTVPDARIIKNTSSQVHHHLKVIKTDTNEPHHLSLTFYEDIEDPQVLVTLRNSKEEIVFHGMLNGDGCLDDFAEEWNIIQQK
jgi:hypothetical protein